MTPVGVRPVCLFSIVGADVYKPRPFDFYSMGEYLHPVAELRAGEAYNGNPVAIDAIGNAQAMTVVVGLDEFCKKYMPSAISRAGDLGSYLDVTFLRQNNPWPAKITAEQVQRIKELVHAFETSFQDELGKVPMFCCEDDTIGNLSVDKLLKGASNGYPAKTKAHLSPKCLTEIDEAGRCLVYDRSTAAGFHLLRSVELTVRQYLQAVSGFVMPPLNRQNWGEYLKLLKDNGAGKEVTDHLYNIKDNYRNPLMHPEDTLEIDEAVSLFGVAQSMNEMLIADMKKRGYI